ncbi:hypothetical protein [Micromonospora nigra]|uniref:hypothetical protein n=1 Tax=Micromonospora nigra TaxID=145857 RepID=UPI000B870ACF|nr:hypothetical protein [Micromonospora nigra]
MIGRLTAVPGLTDREITNMLRVVIAAGLTTCEGALAATSLALAHHRKQLDAFLAACAAGTGMDNAVEVGGHLIRSGDTVTRSLPPANCDGARFPHTDLLDLSRDPSGHLAFDYGVHICLGQRLCPYPAGDRTADPGHRPARGGAGRAPR